MDALKLFAARVLFMRLDCVTKAQELMKKAAEAVWPQPPGLEEQLRARKWAPAAAGRPLMPSRAAAGGATSVRVGGNTFFAAEPLGAGSSSRGGTAASSGRPTPFRALERAASIRDTAASGLIAEMNAESPTPIAAALAVAVPQALPGMTAVELRQCALILRLWLTVEHHDRLLRSPSGVSAERRGKELPHLYKLAMADCQRVLASPADSCRLNSCYRAAHMWRRHTSFRRSHRGLSHTQIFFMGIPQSGGA